jgi:hypothetical protein
MITRFSLGAAPNNVLLLAEQFIGIASETLSGQAASTRNFFSANVFDRI